MAGSVKRERQLARVKSELVSGVSHELRTPLAQIRMFAEMLRLGWVRSDDERQRSVAIIDQEARRLAHLVENILQFSRAERTTPRLSLETLELTALVDEVVESFAPLAGARGVTIKTTHANHTRAVADRNRPMRICRRHQLGRTPDMRSYPQAGDART